MYCRVMERIEPADETSEDTNEDEAEPVGLGQFVLASRDEEAATPKPAPIPWWVAAPALGVAGSVAFICLALFLDDSEDLSEVSSAGALAMLLIPLLIVVLIPWLIIALWKLDSRRR